MAKAQYKTWYGGVMHRWGIFETKHGWEFIPPVDLQAPQLQNTGLKDKNGKEIYEGDVVRILYTDWPSQQAEQNGRYAMSLEDYKNSIAKIRVVIWKVQGFYVSSRIDGYAESMEPGTHGFIEVIGNIFETPSLPQHKEESK